MFMLRNISFIKMNNYKTFTGRSDIFQLLTLHNQHRITGIRYHMYNGHRQYNLFHENRTCIFYTFAPLLRTETSPLSYAAAICRG